MARRRNVYTGVYPLNRTLSPPARSNQTYNVHGVTRMLTTYFWAAYSSINGNYMAIVTVFLIVLLSFILPDISQKIHRTNELKAMKKAIDLMTKQVSRAEVACLTVADHIEGYQRLMHDGATATSRNQQDLATCTSYYMRATQSAPVQVEKKMGFFRRIFLPSKNPSHKEITIMSYLYTDSFDARDKNNSGQEEISVS